MPEKKVKERGGNSYKGSTSERKMENGERSWGGKFRVSDPEGLWVWDLHRGQTGDYATLGSNNRVWTSSGGVVSLKVNLT
jgi:hypothetical protein